MYICYAIERHPVDKKLSSKADKNYKNRNDLQLDLWHQSRSCKFNAASSIRKLFQVKGFNWQTLKYAVLNQTAKSATEKQNHKRGLGLAPKRASSMFGFWLLASTYKRIMQKRHTIYESCLQFQELSAFYVLDIFN